MPARAHVGSGLIGGPVGQLQQQQHRQQQQQQGLERDRGQDAASSSAWGLAVYCVCVVMWGGRSFGLHTSKCKSQGQGPYLLLPSVRAKDRGHTYSLHRTHMGCLTWTVRAHVL
jgi:hypothetical protein